MRKIVFAAALAGMTLSACADKDSYRSGKGGANNPETLTTEEKALAILEQDARFKSVNENEASGEMKESMTAAEVTEKLMQTENTDIAVLQFTFVDNQCTPKQFQTQNFAKDALLKGVKIKGTGRLQCIESDCKDLLLIVEKSGQQFVDGNMRQDIAQAAIAILLSQDENGVYKPVETQSDVFTKVSDVQSAQQKCEEKEEEKSQASAKPTTVSQNTKDAYKTYAQTRVEAQKLDQENKRLAYLDKQISSFESQLRNNSPAAATNGNEVRAKLAAYKAERAKLLERRQKQNLEVIKNGHKEHAASRLSGQSASGSVPVIDPTADTQDPVETRKFGPQ